MERSFISNGIFLTLKTTTPVIPCYFMTSSNYVSFLLFWMRDSSQQKVHTREIRELDSKVPSSKDFIEEIGNHFLHCPSSVVNSKNYILRWSLQLNLRLIQDENETCTLSLTVFFDWQCIITRQVLVVLTLFGNLNVKITQIWHHWDYQQIGRASCRERV